MERLQVKNPLYPLVCILSAIALLVVGLLFAKHPAFPVFLGAVCVLYCLFGLWRTVLKCLVVFLPVSAVFAAFSLLFTRDATAALQVGGRVLLIGISAVPMVTLPPIHLTRNLTQLGAPRIVTLGMLIAIRFVPIIATEVHRVRQAMQTRGARASVYRAFVVPVMVRLISISDTLSLSLETRRFDLDDREATVYKPVRFTLRDGAYCAAAAALAIAMFTVGMGVAV